MGIKMLYERYNGLKETFGSDYFTSRIDEEIIQNLNPNFESREYQKEAFGRFDFYFTDDKKRQYPIHLLFNMATGSGKTLIMAEAVLYLYKNGYRNFIFFVNSTNIIEKTKNNFLNSSSEKYLFAQKIIIGNKEVFIKEVQNFEASDSEDINIIFTTIQGLHEHLNSPRENNLTYEDFTDKDVVLISDEAHHLQTFTKNKKEEKLENSWENTVLKILKSNTKNILLEFTATLDLSNQNIKQKYEEKLIFQYDLKQFRLDKYSKEIEVLQADLDSPIDRALQAVILSQYRRKIAEKHKLRLKPVILFKSKNIKESKENYDKFLNKIKNLNFNDIQEIYLRTKGTILEKAFNYFKEEGITFENLIKELQEDFSEEKIMLLDSENIDEEKQLKLNSLENENNEIRAIFAVNMLNEGWDALNLFDIVRLYDTRDGKWKNGVYKPGNTTMSEAQLIGRGARYFPFQLNETQDKYKRKFDEDTGNELRILETLYYHCFKEPKYIKEIKSALVQIGIFPEDPNEENLFIKEDFKKTDFWKNGVIFINERIEGAQAQIYSLSNAKIESEYEYRLKTGEIREEIIFDESKQLKPIEEVAEEKKYYRLSDFGENILRGALDRINFYQFKKLKEYFPNIKSIREFITSNAYLGDVRIKILGPKDRVNNLTQVEKMEATLYVLQNIADQATKNILKFTGSKQFKAKPLSEIFKDKIVKINKSKNEILEQTKVIDLDTKDWFAQTGFYGTSEEMNFLRFIDEHIDELKQKYFDIALLRNERFFQLFDFDEGRAFEPDFVLLLKKKNGEIINYQIFIEPKGDQFKDSLGKFDNSEEGWKQKFLLEIEKQAKLEGNSFINAKKEQFKIIGLPFYNETSKKEFEEVFINKLLK